ncbi:MAG: T9SS type B sorting domain-containing protein [Saprospiraceae bacterium]|nr:MAG: T9SS type B sorting domain-containing protein [Saprospiraceae bacterium]
MQKSVSVPARTTSKSSTQKKLKYTCPNGDGANDVFLIFAKPGTVKKIKSFLVFSRWGEAVFEYFNFQPNDPAYGWDGMYRGQPMKPAVFVWFAEVEFTDGGTELFEGDVTLVR